MKIGFHRGTFDFMRLENKKVEKKENGDGKDNNLSNFQ